MALMAQYAGLPEGAEIISQPQYAGLPAGAEIINRPTQPQASPAQSRGGVWDHIVGYAEEVAAGVNQGAETLQRKMFGSTSGTFAINAQWWRQKAQANGIDQNTVAAKVAEGVGQVPASLPEWLPTPTGVAVGTALAASGGYTQTDENGQQGGVVGALEGAAKHLAYRTVFKVIDAIPLAASLPGIVKSAFAPVASGAVMAGGTALEGGNANDVTAAAILGAVPAALGHTMKGKPEAEPAAPIEQPIDGTAPSSADPETVSKIKTSLVKSNVPEDVAQALAEKGAHIDTSNPQNVQAYTEALAEAKKIANPTIELDHNVATPGLRVKAADRDNIGTILHADHDAETADVHFVSPEGSEATVNLPFDQLSELHSGDKVVSSDILKALDQNTKANDRLSEPNSGYELSGDALKNFADQFGETVNKEFGDHSDNEGSLINLDRLNLGGRGRDIVKELGDLIRPQLEAKLGKDSGKLDNIINEAVKNIVKSNSRDTGVEFGKKMTEDVNSNMDLAVRTTMYRQALAHYTEKVSELASIANKQGADESDVALYHYYLQKLHDVQALDAQNARQIAWAMNARKLVVDGSGVDFNDLSKEDLAANPAMRQHLVDTMNQNGGYSEVQKTANDYLKAADLQQKIAVIKKANKASFLNVFNEFRSTNMLSSMFQASKHVTGEGMRILLEDGFENPIAAGWGKLLGSEDAISFRESLARAIGNVHGAVESFGRVFPAMKELPGFFQKSDTPFNAMVEAVNSVESWTDARGFNNGMSTRVIEGSGRKAMTSAYMKDIPFFNWSDGILRSVGESIGAKDTIADSMWNFVNLYGASARLLTFGRMKLTDTPFEYMGWNANAYGMAYKKAMEKGLNGQDATDYISNVVAHAKALRDGVQLPASETAPYRTDAKEINEASLKANLDRTWKGDMYGQMGQEMDRFMNNTLTGKVAKATAMPFFSTPMRLLEYGAQRSIATAWLTKQWRDDISGVNGTRARDLALAKVTMGSLIQGAALYLIQSGFITAQPTSNQKKGFRDAGILDFSIRIGDRQYQFNQLHPLGALISELAAPIYAWNTTKNNDAWERAGAVAGSVVDDIIGRDYLKGVMDLASAATDDSGKKLKSWFVRYSGSLVPYSGIANFAQEKLGDGVSRQVNSVGDQFLKAYAPTFLKPQLDSYGKEMADSDRVGHVRSAAMPDFNSARMEVVKHGIDLPQAPKMIDLAGGGASGFGYVLTPEDQYNYMHSLSDPAKGINMEQSLQAVVNSQKYQKLNPELQETVLKELVRLAHGQAKAFVVAQNSGDNAVVQTAKNKADGLKELFTTPGQDPKGNMLKFLTGYQSQRRDIMNAHGVQKAP
jgi:hypothetical protein